MWTGRVPKNWAQGVGRGYMMFPDELTERRGGENEERAGEELVTGETRDDRKLHQWVFLIITRADISTLRIYTAELGGGVAHLTGMPCRSSIYLKSCQHT